jgi:hypothetical protein
MVTAARRALIVMLYFGAVSAFGGAALGVATDGGGVPHEFLRGSPFESFLVPSLILGVVIGGTQLIGALAVHRGASRADLAAATAGFGMIVWIFVELAIIGFDWLQAFYFAVGIAQLGLVLVTRGILSASTAAEPTGHLAQPRGTTPTEATIHG